VTRRGRPAPARRPVAPVADAPLDADPLVEVGRVPHSRDGRVLVVACGALAREIAAVLGANGLDHVDLHCLPAILHNAPDRIPDAVDAALAERPGYDSAFVAYADCGTGGRLAAVCAAHGVEMIAGPHCYAFVEGLEVFAARDEIDAFYLTDFLARQFDAFVTRPLGLDRHPDLRDTYFGHYRKLVYLAQTEDAELTARAKLAAVALGLTFERRFTGLGPFAEAVRAVRP